MDTIEKALRLYLTASGASPFERWFDALSDQRAQERILARLNRLRLGNFGDCKALGSGICELRIDYGPGYRVYFGREGNEIVILLAGGTKSRQARDIERAKEFWHDYETSKTTKNF